jgi:hypothetical protein
MDDGVGSRQAKNLPVSRQEIPIFHSHSFRCRALAADVGITSDHNSGVTELPLVRIE